MMREQILHILMGNSQGRRNFKCKCHLTCQKNIPKTLGSGREWKMERAAGDEMRHNHLSRRRHISWPLTFIPNKMGRSYQKILHRKIAWADLDLKGSFWHLTENGLYKRQWEKKRKPGRRHPSISGVKWNWERLEWQLWWQKKEQDSGKFFRICGRIGCGLKKEKNHSSLSGKLKRQSCFLLDVEDWEKQVLRHGDIKSPARHPAGNAK